jgi:hypothetical protein
MPLPLIHQIGGQTKNLWMCGLNNLAGFLWRDHIFRVLESMDKRHGHMAWTYRVWACSVSLQHENALWI